MLNGYCRRSANTRIRKIRDKHGTRVIFSNGDIVNPRYVNINRATLANKFDLQKAYEIQKRNKSKLQNNMRKIKRKLIVL